ncbi:hypothetical protein C8R43DRAFT_895082 [Mycena crocata]|nr:hypothetical protein C8R43DRAFT_895082 [Mycena crocata]
MYPICARLQNFKLLQRALPASVLTQKTGISSLLVFMGTGQGTKTSEFLGRMIPHGKMHFKNLADCVEEFTKMEITRTTLDPASVIPYENSAIYGQANTWYSLKPWIRLPNGQYRQLTITEKLTLYFSAELQESWHGFIGLLADQDPATSTVPCRSWKETVTWIVRQELRGFITGLGAMQFANNLVLSGISESPSPESMAAWIFANKSYGAFEGLRVLGFNLPATASASAVQAAFFCYYFWLDTHLTVADKRWLDFGPICAEQLL